MNLETDLFITQGFHRLQWNTKTSKKNHPMASHNKSVLTKTSTVIATLCIVCVCFGNRYCLPNCTSLSADLEMLLSTHVTFCYMSKTNRQLFTWVTTKPCELQCYNYDTKCEGHKLTGWRYQLHYHEDASIKPAVGQVFCVPYWSPQWHSSHLPAIH